MDHPPLSDLLDDGSRADKEDPTEQGRVAEELRKSEDRFRMLADNISQLMEEAVRWLSEVGEEGGVRSRERESSFITAHLPPITSSDPPPFY